jgi:carnitine O-palmitoyltransferase 2
LKYILDDASPPTEYPVGVLTTENRNTWAEARRHLESIGNADVFSLIDSGIFMLCFDDVEIAGNLHFMLRNFMHSDGCNR